MNDSHAMPRRPSVFDDMASHLRILCRGKLRPIPSPTSEQLTYADLCDFFYSEQTGQQLSVDERRLQPDKFDIPVIKRLS